MSLFDLTPKDRSSELFGRAVELEELCRLVEARRWSVVLGPRMVGKTSLVKAVRHRLKRPGAYVNLWGVRSVQGLVEGIIAGINESASLRARLVRAGRRIEGIGIGSTGLSVSAPRRPLRTAWELLDLLGAETDDCVIVLDEVQELAPNAGALLKLLGNLFNTRPNVVFVFTGSLIGLTRTLTEPTADSPLLGRAPVSLTLKGFDRATSLEFLRRGTKEAGVRPADEVLEAAVDGPLDGTPGWLTLFGNKLVVSKLEPRRALAETLSEGKLVAESEVAHFLEGRDGAQYWAALKAMAVGASWTVIRDQVSRSVGRPVNDATIQRIVRATEGTFLAARTAEGYALVDPMVRAYVAEAGRAPLSVVTRPSGNPQDRTGRRHRRTRPDR